MMPNKLRPIAIQTINIRFNGMASAQHGSAESDHVIDRIGQTPAAQSAISVVCHA